MFSILKSDLVNPFEPMGEELKQELDVTITQALSENRHDDVFVNLDQPVTVKIKAEEDCVLCGAPWVDGVLEKINFTGKIEWHAIEGSMLLAGDKVCTIHTDTKDILGIEKVVLNFLSLLSTYATYTRSYAELLSDSEALLYYDYLKYPGLGLSQQYAARVGGGQGYIVLENEEYLISKSIIYLSGGIFDALQQALDRYSIDFIKIEISSLQELEEAINLGITHIKLCYFTAEQIAQARDFVNGKAILEVYGNVHLGNIKEIAQMEVAHIVIEDFGKKLPIVRYSLSYKKN